ncbi:MAG: hypothetical protein AAGA90_14525 [Actinomycetota bacterium]
MEPDRQGRRDLLKKGAVTTGVIWSAPAILSFDPVAAAAGSTLGAYTYCFDDGTTEGWTIDNTAGAGNGLWNVDNGRSVSPSFSLHYGNGVGGTFETGGRNAGTVTSPSVTIPAVGPVDLEFEVWREVEVFASGTWDEFSVSILPTGDVLYARSRDGGTSGVFESVSIDLSAYAGDTVQIVLAFDTGDGAFNDFEGIYVDNITVPGASAPVGGLGVVGGFGAFSFTPLNAPQPGWMPARPEPSAADVAARGG